MVKLPWYFAFAFIFCLPAAVLAEPIASMVPQEGVRLVLHDEQCKLGTQVVNLPQRATWEENGQVQEGCYGVDQQRRLVRIYFSDKTVVAAYVGEFQKIVGT